MAETRTSLGLVQILEWDWRGAESTLRTVIDKHPRHALAYVWLAWLLSNLDRPAEAMFAATRGNELDPLAPVVNGVTALVHYHAREYDKAIEHCERALELDPVSFIGLLTISLSYAHEGRYEQAINYATESTRLSPTVVFLQSLLGVVYAMAGKVDESRGVLAAMKQRAHTDYVAPILLAWVYAHLNEIDLAFECLDRAYEERSCTIALGIRAPMYDPLRLDPRFATLLRRLGLS
jgi:tetratricopeptide (TPR) repeat protein